MFKMKMDIDRHGPRPMPNNCKNLNPPNFSLASTFKRFEEIHIWLQHLYVDVRERKETHLNILRWFLFKFFDKITIA